ncbi:AraC family transcriptional regulator ligand-binding domain-containing protein [Streptomyces sp. NPDC097619]|uniref:AraC family transcriptional regulator ligand-binding domain-containing protein n=1 Tax=Streptomyces sp. NPDC097619 TaxID=3157228 RepID=UPI0033310078
MPDEQFEDLLGMAPAHLTGDRFRTPSTTNIRIWELLTTRAPWTEVALLMARRAELGTFGVWDYLLTSAPTPLQGLRDAAHYVAAIGDAGTEQLLITEDGGHVTLSHANAAELTYETASAIRSFSLGLLRRRLGEALGRPVTPVRVAVAATSPRSHGALAELYGTTAIEFGVPISSITFRTADLDVPSPHAPPGLSDLLRGHADRYLDEAVPLYSWIDEFRLALGAEGPDSPALRTVAQRLAMSTRTLQRRLEAYGTTWSAELEAERRTRVLRMLRTTDLPLGSVADRTGYADVRAMRRAVRRWTGHTSTDLRRGVAPEGPEGAS